MSSAAPVPVDLMYPSLRDVEEAAAAGDLDRLIDAVAERATDGGRWNWTPWWLARALRVDRAAILANPASTLQNMWRRGFFHTVNGQQPLREVLNRWRAEHGDRPWARALRAAPDPLDGPLVEEYRGEFREVHRVELRGGEIVCGTRLTEHVIDRATGTVRSRAERSLPVEEASSWVLPRDQQRPGAFRLVDRATGQVIEGVTGNQMEFDQVTMAADARILIMTGHNLDYDAVVACVDLTRSRLRWQRSAWSQPSRAWIAPDSSRVLVFVEGTLAVIDADTGEVRRRLQVGPDCRAIGCDDDLAVVVASDSIRVLRLDPLEAGYGLPGAHGGLTDVLWSPDGRRLLTGEVLCDGVSGKVRSTLALENSKYLEGGPVDQPAAIGGTVLVELGAMRGYRRWDAATGRLLHADRNRIYDRHGDRVWIAPDAELVVHARRKFPDDLTDVQLQRTDTFAVLARFTDVTTVAWSPDASRLAVGHRDGTIGIWTRTGTRLGLIPRTSTDVGDGPVCALAYAADGAVLVAANDRSATPDRSGPAGPILRFWDDVTGRLLGTRHLVGGEDVTYNYPTGSADLRQYRWKATPANLERLHGQHGFAARRHPYRVGTHNGYVVLEPDQPHLPSYQIPDAGPLWPDPTGRRWASRTTHICLEPDSLS